MNNQRPYAQPMARPQNQAGPSIRAGLSVQELKAMTAMRCAHDGDSSNPGINPRDTSNVGPYRNPASSYQTATPQQLQAAGIAPVVINERTQQRQQKPAPNAYTPYAPTNTYGELDQLGQNRSYNYDSVSGPSSSRNLSEGSYGSTSSYAKASSTAGVAPALSTYHQQILPNRNGAPQINSVEDVKEMTRLRMLMAERDAFFESSTSSGRSTADAAPGALSHQSSGHQDFEIPFEETNNSRYGSRLLSGPSVNNSTDSFDSYDFPHGVAPEARARGLQPSHAHSPLVGGQSLGSAQSQKSLYGPPSQQHQMYSNSGEYSSNSSTNSSAKLSQSSSLGGLGLRGPGMGHSAYGHGSQHELSSPLSGPLASPSYGSSALRPNLGGAQRAPGPVTQLGLGLAGSGVVGRRPQPLGSSSLTSADRGLTQHSHAQQGQYGGYPVERGIERNLMLNAQLTGHSHHLHGLGSGIDRVEQSLNGHNHSHNNNHHQYDDLLQPASYNGHHGLSLNNTNSSRGLSSGVNSGSGVSPTTHSGRSAYSLQGSNNNNNNHNNNNNYLYGNSHSHREDVSLNALLGDHHPYPAFEAPTDRKDTLYDLLNTDHMDMPRHHQNNNNNLQLLQGLEVQSSPQKVVLGPLAITSSPIGSNNNTAAATASSVLNLSVDTRVSPRTLAPLTESPAKESPTPNSTSTSTPSVAAAAAVRKLSLVGRAATYNDASPALKEKRSVVVLPELETSAKLEPHRISAFGEEGSPSHLGNGIASPDNNEAKAPLSNKRFPLIKASTTSRIPSDSQSPGTRSPKLMLAGKNRLLSNNNNSNEYTPPGTALDRAASDSGGMSMNFLASEMAEMVLDTPTQMMYNRFSTNGGGGGGGMHSRESSSDLSRLLAAINNSGSDAADNSLPSVTGTGTGTGGKFKRITSISSFLGFE